MKPLSREDLQTYIPRISEVAIGGLYMVGFYLNLPVVSATLAWGNTLQLKLKEGEIMVNVSNWYHELHEIDGKTSIRIKTEAKYSAVHSKKPETVVVFLK